MEYGLIARAIEQLAQQFGLIRIALVGHSGGSSAIMGALSLGIKKGDCIIVGSGNYEIADMAVRKYENQGTPVGNEQKRAWQVAVFNHHRSLGGILPGRRRRIFVAGDPTDPFAPFAQQVRYAESLQAAGHSVRLVEAKAPNGDNHTFINNSLRAAARCLRGEGDARVASVLGGVLRIP
jgi:pimeloyl-ACP methyl ester carboxylesterase